MNLKRCRLYQDAHLLTSILRKRRSSWPPATLRYSPTSNKKTHFVEAGSDFRNWSQVIFTFNELETLSDFSTPKHASWSRSLQTPVFKEHSTQELWMLPCISRVNQKTHSLAIRSLVKHSRLQGLTKELEMLRLTVPKTLYVSPRSSSRISVKELETLRLMALKTHLWIHFREACSSTYQKNLRYFWGNRAHDFEWRRPLSDLYFDSLRNRFLALTGTLAILTAVITNPDNFTVTTLLVASFFLWGYNRYRTITANRIRLNTVTTLDLLADTAAIILLLFASASKSLVTWIVLSAPHPVHDLDKRPLIRISPQAIWTVHIWRIINSSNITLPCVERMIKVILQMNGRCDGCRLTVVAVIFP